MTHDPDSSQAIGRRSRRAGALERGDAVPAQALRVGERALGSGDQLVGRRRVGRQAGDAEARGDRPVRERVCRDTNDDQFIACALAAQADAIVTRDNDLLSLGKPFGIPVLTPRQLLSRIK